MSGPHSPCARGACAGRSVHLAGRHLDPRDELYDGPELLLKVLPLAVREQARRLVAGVPPELVPDVIELAQHVEWQRQQVAAVRVDGERREREAMARSADCEHHGREIEELAAQAHRTDRVAHTNDAARIALLGLLETVRDFVEVYRAGRAAPDLTVKSLVDALDKAVRKTSAAHDRAWKR